MASSSSRGLAPAFFLLLGVSGAAGLAGELQPSPPAARQTELVHMVRHDCGSCHGMSLRGGLGPALTAEALQQRPIEYLEAMILRGRSGTAMPGWQGLIDANDARWIAQQLKDGFPNER